MLSLTPLNGSASILVDRSDLDSDAENRAPSDAETENYDDLRERIAFLSKKNHADYSFIQELLADREYDRTLLQESTTRCDDLREINTVLVSKQKELESRVQDLRNRLATSENAREDAQTDHDLLLQSAQAKDEQIRILEQSIRGQNNEALQAGSRRKHIWKMLKSIYHSTQILSRTNEEFSATVETAEERDEVQLAKEITARVRTAHETISTQEETILVLKNQLEGVDDLSEPPLLRCSCQKSSSRVSVVVPLQSLEEELQIAQTHEEVQNAPIVHIPLSKSQYTMTETVDQPACRGCKNFQMTMRNVSFLQNELTKSHQRERQANKQCETLLNQMKTCAKEIVETQSQIIEIQSQTRVVSLPTTNFYPPQSGPVARNQRTIENLERPMWLDRRVDFNSLLSNAVLQNADHYEESIAKNSRDDVTGRKLDKNFFRRLLSRTYGPRDLCLDPPEKEHEKFKYKFKYEACYKNQRKLFVVQGTAVQQRSYGSKLVPAIE